MRGVDAGRVERLMKWERERAEDREKQSYEYTRGNGLGTSFSATYGVPAHCVSIIEIKKKT